MMDAPSLVKALLMQAAYQGASAVCVPLATDDGKPLPIDPLIKDLGLQKKGVLVYELAKIQYHALINAFHDKSGVWPDPKVPEDSGDVGGLVSRALGLLGQLPRDMPLGNILDLLGRATGVVRTPGQELN